MYPICDYKQCRRDFNCFHRAHRFHPHWYIISGKILSSISIYWINHETNTTKLTTKFYAFVQVDVVNYRLCRILHSYTVYDFLCNANNNNDWILWKIRTNNFWLIINDDDDRGYHCNESSKLKYLLPSNCSNNGWESFRQCKKHRHEFDMNSVGLSNKIMRYDDLRSDFYLFSPRFVDEKQSICSESPQLIK